MNVCSPCGDSFGDYLQERGHLLQLDGGGKRQIAGAASSKLVEGVNWAGKGFLQAKWSDPACMLPKYPRELKITWLLMNLKSLACQ